MAPHLARFRLLPTAALLAGALALAGCTADAPEGPEASSVPESAGPSTDAKAVVQNFDPADAVAELEVTQKGDDTVTATIQVLPLQVDGDVMLLRLVVTPHTTDASARENRLGVGLFTLLNGFFSPTLRDLDNLKVYSALSGSGLSTNDVVAMPWDQPSPHYVYFAAPQDDIDSIDLQLANAWPAITDVPIER